MLTSTSHLRADARVSLSLALTSAKPFHTSVSPFTHFPSNEGELSELEGLLEALRGSGTAEVAKSVKCLVSSIRCRVLAGT